MSLSEVVHNYLLLGGKGRLKIGDSSVSQNLERITSVLSVAATVHTGADEVRGLVNKFQ